MASELPASDLSALSATMLAVLSSARAPLTPLDLRAQLPRELRDGSDDAAINAALSELERTGRVVCNRAGLLLVAARANLLSGQVQGHRDGFGFLIRDDAGSDLVLPEHEMSKVLHGDRVLARIAGTDRRGRPEGEIVEVIEHRTHRVVGRLLDEGGVLIVVPEDQRITHDILIPPGAATGAEAGQVVVAQIVQQPQRHVQPVGRVVEVLGAIDDPGMEIEIAVRKFSVPHEFSREALTVAELLPEGVTARDLKHRVDLRDVPLVTIDGEDARDFDDAVYCEPIGSGKTRKWRLIVAIADVSHYVKPGEPLDIDAQSRSTSVYFPRRVIPMLPEKLSNGLCSLNPLVDRLVLVADAVIGAKGVVTAYQFYPAVMRSNARLTYTEVWDALSLPDSSAAKRIGALMPHLVNLHQLYQVLSQARNARGAIDMETTETAIVCDAQGRIEKILPRTRNDAHKLIEECMLAANVCAADLLMRHKHPALYRVHEGPTPERLTNVRTMLKTLGLALEGGEAPEPMDYARLLGQIRPRPDAPLLQTVLLRSMQQAVYSPHNSGHFGLAYPQYTHFTSPIRRYPDLLTHRAIKAVLTRSHYRPILVGAPTEPAPLGVRRALLPPTGPTGGPLAVWEKLGLLCSANERRADEASRDVEAWLKSYYMRDRVGETASGTVSAVVPFGIFVVLDDLYVEGLVHVSELGSEYFHFNESLHELRGERTGLRYRLADRVTVQVARVDLEARRIEFRLMRGNDRKSPLHALAGVPGSAVLAKHGKRKDETPEQRRARRAADLGKKKPRDIDKRERSRHGEAVHPGKRGIGGRGQ